MRNISNISKGWVADVGGRYNTYAGQQWHYPLPPTPVSFRAHMQMSVTQGTAIASPICSPCTTFLFRFLPTLTWDPMRPLENPDEKFSFGNSLNERIILDF